MKLKRNILLILLITLNVVSKDLFAQNLSNLSQSEREKKLIEVAQNVYKAPCIRNFYREYGTPTITETKTIDLPSSEIERIYNDPNSIWYGGKNSQKYYIVYFHYDLNKERFDEGYAAKVYIWENTGNAFAISLGNGITLPVRNGQVPNHNNQPEPVKYYTITYSNDVPNASSLPQTGKYGDVITITLKTTKTESYDGWTIEQGYNFDSKKDIIGGEVISDNAKYFTQDSYDRIIQLMVTGDMKVNITRYIEEYEAPY